MRRDVINGFEWLIFEEREIKEARRVDAFPKEDGIHPRVRIATFCFECGEYVQCSIETFDNRLKEPVRHFESHHQAMYRFDNT